MKNFTFNIILSEEIHVNMWTFSLILHQLQNWEKLIKKYMMFVKVQIIQTVISSKASPFKM